MNKLMTMISALLLITVSQAFAHDWWLNKSEHGYDIVKGHIEKDDSIMADSYEAGKVVQATGYLANGEGFPINISRKKDKSGDCILLPENFSALTAFIYDNCWIKTTKGWSNNKVINGNPAGLIRQGQSYKYTKHIEKWHDRMAKPLGQRLEIVPLKDVSGLQQGNLLPVALFFMGKKIHEAELTQVSREDTLTKMKTDDNFNVKIGDSSFQLIRARVEIPLTDRNFIWYTATLTFNTGSTQ